MCFTLDQKVNFEINLKIWFSVLPIGDFEVLNQKSKFQRVLIQIWSLDQNINFETKLRIWFFVLPMGDSQMLDQKSISPRFPNQIGAQTFWPKPWGPDHLTPTLGPRPSDPNLGAQAPNLVWKSQKIWFLIQNLKIPDGRQTNHFSNFISKLIFWSRAPVSSLRPDLLIQNKAKEDKRECQKTEAGKA